MYVNILRYCHTRKWFFCTNVLPLYLEGFVLRNGYLFINTLLHILYLSFPEMNLKWQYNYGLWSAVEIVFFVDGNQWIVFNWFLLFVHRIYLFSNRLHWHWLPNNITAIEFECFGACTLPHTDYLQSNSIFFYYSSAYSFIDQWVFASHHSLSF